jgi:hypothetical protein
MMLFSLSAPTRLIDSRYSPSDKATHTFEPFSANRKSRVAEYLLTHTQPVVLSPVARVQYRHIG